MRAIFAGTPEFAATGLRALLVADAGVGLVLTQPDRPAGRGLKQTHSAVKQVAIEHGLALLQPVTLREPAIQQILRDFAPDVMVVAAYGLILPPEVLAIPVHGCINIHASLLPRWRGAAPIQRALLAGDEETGVCIMRMEAGLDTGPVLLRRATPIRPDDTAGTLHDRLADIGARAIVETIAALKAGGIAEQAQPEAGVTYAAKIRPAEAALDFGRSAIELERAVRAWNPWPIAHSALRGQAVRVWAARAEAGRPGSAPGTVLSAGSDGVAIACGEGQLTCTELQRPGRGRLQAAEFLRGFPISPGERFAG